MSLQTGGIAQVLEDVPSKLESLTLNPSMQRERKNLVYLHLILFSTRSFWDLYF
jgi:hypothetical protein